MDKFKSEQVATQSKQPPKSTLKTESTTVIATENTDLVDSTSAISPDSISVSNRAMFSDDNHSKDHCPATNLKTTTETNVCASEPTDLSHHHRAHLNAHEQHKANTPSFPSPQTNSDNCRMRCCSRSEPPPSALDFQPYEHERQYHQICEMGFYVHDLSTRLSRHNGDVSRVIQELLEAPHSSYSI